LESVFSEAKRIDQMKFGKTAIFVVVALIPLSSGHGVASQEQESPQLSIAVAIPANDWNLPRSVRKLAFNKAPRGGMPDFHVVITNVSGDPVHLWEEWCSWGHHNLSLELIGTDGGEVQCTKRKTAWTRNYPDDFLVEPGEHYVIDVYFDSDNWREPAFDKLKADNDGTIGLRAVYQSDPDEFSAQHHVWTGRLVSEECRVVVER
jgi:hypothetical protein